VDRQHDLIRLTFLFRESRLQKWILCGLIFFSGLYVVCVNACVSFMRANVCE